MRPNTSLKWACVLIHSQTGGTVGSVSAESSYSALDPTIHIAPALFGSSY
jgi:hypothetical protein